MVSKNILSIRLQTLNYLSLLRKKVFLNAILCFTKSLQCIRQNAFILIFSITSLSKGFLTKKLLPPLQLFTSEFLFDSFSMCNDYMKVHYYWIYESCLDPKSCLIYQEKNCYHNWYNVFSRCGPLIDLCRGPHVRHTGKVKAFAVTKNSATYWEGKADAESLQRIYGISFPDPKQLKEWKHFQEEAAKRDHRKIGKVRNFWSLIFIY